MLARSRGGTRLRRPLMWGAIILILAAPLIAMQFTSEVAWTLSAFIAAAALLVVGGVFYELTALMLSEKKHRIIAGATIILIVLILWAQGSVGIFG